MSTQCVVLRGTETVCFQYLWISQNKYRPSGAAPLPSEVADGSMPIPLNIETSVDPLTCGGLPICQKKANLCNSVWQFHH